MVDSILIDIATVFVLGTGAQWLAWRFRLPSILLLLLAGFAAGPVFGLLSPAALQGDWVSAFVSVSIGIILFEGGLSLRLSELREVGSSVLNLITLGVLVTWLLGAAAAYVILDFNVSLSILLGAILTVTGPTVVIPLLRHVRPKGRVSTIAKWEGITIDPIGAILAVLVLETVLLLHQPMASGDAVVQASGEVLHALLLEIVVALGVGVIGFTLLVLILSRRLVPDFLRNPVTLMIVVACFVMSNELRHESGLLTTTLMGIALANQPYASVQRIIEFKENLQVLLIGSLFIVLSARLELSALQYVDYNALVFLGILVIVVRPLAVFLSTWGLKATWEEKVFLSWMAPRGIVAAAVASLFAFELIDIFPQEAQALVPIVFLVIVGTVAIYGLTAAPLARWLDLADPSPEGLLFIGAAPWVRKIALLLQDEVDHRVSLVDSNPDHIREARRAGMHAQQADALSESALDDLDLNGIGRLLITIPNDEVASLTALHFSEIFETTDIYQLAARPDSRQAEEGGGAMPRHLRGRPLFGENTSYHSIKDHFEEGDRLKVIRLSDEVPDERQQEYYSFSDLEEQHTGTHIIPLFLETNGSLNVVSELNQFAFRPGDTLIALVDKDYDDTALEEFSEDPFETASLTPSLDAAERDAAERDAAERDAAERDDRKNDDRKNDDAGHDDTAESPSMPSWPPEE